jgi:hypothetical protein
MLPVYDFDVEFQKAKRKEEEIKQFLQKRNELLLAASSTASVIIHILIKF